MSTVYIVGAGFSSYAGLPLQSEFTQRLIGAREYRKGPSLQLMREIDKFVEAAFTHEVDGVLSDGSEKVGFPQLEDLFTCLDLSANTGHNLGMKYTPSRLRTVRRALISRIIYMLHNEYAKERRKASKKLETLGVFLKSIDRDKSSFVSLNWDVSLESVLMEAEPNWDPNYGANIFAAEIFGEKDAVRRIRSKGRSSLPIAKVHGSANWLYCDCCRKGFWFHPERSRRIAAQILSRAEQQQIQGEIKERLYCPSCPTVELGLRLATFSYRKALDCALFQSAWSQAERSLMNATNWVFIGYSLPAADFEFKYLLKRTELAKRKRPSITVVSGRKTKTLSPTIDNFRQFFGDRVVGISGGLTPGVISQLSEL